VAIVRKRLGLRHDLYTLLQVLSLTLFEKTPIIWLLAETASSNGQGGTPNQLNLFD